MEDVRRSSRASGLHRWKRRPEGGDQASQAIWPNRKRISERSSVQATQSTIHRRLWPHMTSPRPSLPGQKWEARRVARTHVVKTSGLTLPSFVPEGPSVSGPSGTGIDELRLPVFRPLCLDPPRGAEPTKPCSRRRPGLSKRPAAAPQKRDAKRKHATSPLPEAAAQGPQGLEDLFDFCLSVWNGPSGAERGDSA